MSKRKVKDVIDLTFSSDEESDTRHLVSHRIRNSIRKKVKTDDVNRSTDGVKKPEKAIKCENESAERNILGDDDEIEIIENVGQTFTPETIAAEAKSNNEGDNDLVVVGTRNQIILPHNRFDCTKHIFQMNHSNEENVRKNNAIHCSKCYCYVCDNLASECKSWNTGEYHCNASDKLSYWRNLRMSKKQKERSKTNPPSCQTPPLMSPYQDPLNFYAPIFSPGPWAPDDPEGLRASSEDDTVKQCRNCGWFDRYRYRHIGINFSEEWCKKCGIVASESFFDKNQSPIYKCKKDDIFLGERTIPFHIATRDVRSMNKYRGNWRKAKRSKQGWKYDEAEMKEDLFRHCLGKHPKLKSILYLLSSVGEENVVRNGREDDDTIIIEDHNDIALLKILYRVQFDKETSSGHRMSEYGGDISASWDKTKQLGELKLRVYLPNTVLTSKLDSLDLFFGAWFNLFPFALTDISGFRQQDENHSRTNMLLMGSDHPSNSKLMNDACDRYKKDIEFISDQLTLSSSTGSVIDGDLNKNDGTLKEVLKHYFREGFSAPYRNGYSWDNVRRGVLRKETRKALKHGLEIVSNPLELVLNYQDMVMAQHLDSSARGINSMQRVLEIIENLGHEEIPYVEGLNVELLEFQKQTLKWCIERENVPGGIQSYLWPKVPFVEDKGIELYFNPILQRCRKNPPQVVRGGFLAEEMGLGKTIISLALVLQNCAPMHPLSGSPVAAISSSSVESNNVGTWDRGLYQRTSGEVPKRGSIISRGTLVICPVSLVGQWIEEAKSKLKNPGLIYAYHGSNRKRDPEVLAKNAIVVTTYQVLASDDTYFRRKKGPDYCPPCEIVRWWRIICDEGHHLRERSTKRSAALSNLVADHKWLVSGTPMNTNIDDLKNQLRFLGFEDIDSYFTAFRFRHGRYNTGSLLLFLRNIIIRHSQKQTYRNTKTTLMSLPKKTERSIEVKLSAQEVKEYKKLEEEAKDFYSRFKEEHETEISKHYLKLFQKLMPMRVACAGGTYPLMNGQELEDDDGDGEAKEDTNLKKEIKHSDFVFKSKFKKLISELKRIRDKDPSSKSLVFSQFKSTLSWLQDNLPKHGFQFRTLTGDMSMRKRAKALSDFQKDPPTTIFLLSMRAGNCGINLTQANQIFLMEPSFNPALEKQAIGRVHRLGQKREVEVTRLLIKNSVETRIQKILRMKYGIQDTAKEDENGEPKAKNSSALASPIGNLSSEWSKNQILTDEFDILFEVGKSISQTSTLPDQNDHPFVSI